MKLLSALGLIYAVTFAGPAAAQACDGCMHGPHAEHGQPGPNTEPGGHGGGMQQGMGGMQQGMGGMHSMVRHQLVMREGLPEAYRDLTNPLAVTESTLAQGQDVYAAQCARCHGSTGQGDGPEGTALDPRPSNLAQLPRMPMMSSDAYLHWTVAEGGTPVGSAMPGFKETLTTDEIWSVILYLRAGVGTAAGDSARNDASGSDASGPDESGHDTSGHPAAGH